MNTQVSLDAKVNETTDNKTALKPKINSSKNVNSSARLRYRLMIFLRFVLAIFGGYYLAAISATVLGMSFSSEPLKANAVLSATMLAFVLYCAVFIWVFMVSSTLKAWLGVIVPSLVMTVLYGLMKG